MSAATFNGAFAMLQRARSNGAAAAAPAFSPRSQVNALEQKLETLQKDHAELNAAIFEAAQVHRRLCAPSLIHYGPFDIASEIFAVRHLPGDFFTVEETDRGLVFALGDIGGKGLAAGMWVTHLIGLIRTHTAVSSDPEEIASGVNRDVARLAAVEPLSTMFVGRLDAGSATLDYCSAGHPAALLLRADAHMESLSEGGPVLGVVPTASFKRGTVQLGSRDVMLVCSDGILESFDEGEREFGVHRLEAEFRRAEGGSAEAILFSVLGAVQDFAAPRPLTDDMTLVIVQNE
ncbi:MAG TPA: PP2C family protein-serine/threonine phosphatase, partial [Pyrinomonadaceae bacterium]|jgi:sigma-B regulation protein RsbU (phosphoserine phosphatase)|nr:PP2C family protein-serine/threonine phosphatase [Pyrinomonadaceae bacterium]